MREPPDDVLPRAVLFICYLNSIRSPMAQGLMRKRFGHRIYVESCGLAQGDLDDLMVTTMREVGVDMSAHEAQTLAQLQDASFDVVIAFTQDAENAARAAFEGMDTEIELWPTPDPTAGSLDVRAMLNNYRSIRSYIDGRIERRFGGAKPASAP